MTTVTEAKTRVYNEVYERAVRSGRVPRRSYTHYFIESEGLHSRIHLQNFWSTFWPGEDVEATAHVRAFAPDGRQVAKRHVQLPRFGCMFLELRELLANRKVAEGSVAVDLEPPAAVRKHFGDLPAPNTVHVNTPFWMAYYDDDENYMYVHSIEVLGGSVKGTIAPLRWYLGRVPAQRESWRSWRLLDLELLDELQVVVSNQDTKTGETVVGIYAADGEPLWQRSVALGPRQLRRVRVTGEEIAGWRKSHPGAQVRIGLEPLLSTNGKPYVMMRYGGGPLSVHHG